MKVASRYLNFCGQIGEKILAALVVVLMIACGTASAADRRVAFVVGNSNYQSVPTLPNPRNDAEAVAAALKKSGFEVITAVDVDRQGFDVAMEKFVRSMNGADLSVFYFSGHGLQVGGENRIVPIDAELKSPADLEVETISVKTIMSYMRSNSKIQLVYLDSCRNNPFPSSSYLVGTEKRVAIAGIGLAPQEALLGSLTSYSTQPGALAIDGTGDKSPFTESILAHSFKLGVDVKTALQTVTDEVWKATNQKQKPYTSEALVKPVFLSRPAIRIAPVAQNVAAATPSVKVGAAPTQEATQDTTKTEPATQTPPKNEFGSILVAALSDTQRVPIGVGQVALLDKISVVRAASTAQIEITAVPKSGVFYLDGKPLGGGDLLDEDSLRKVTFEPAVDSGDVVQEVSFKVTEANGSAPVEVTAKISPFVVACDTEASEPLDLQGIGRGKLLEEINPAAAVQACTDAVQKYPNVARYKFELARAKFAAKDLAGALDLFKQAASAGYVRANNQLGQMVQAGQGQQVDLPAANKFFKAAADQGDPLAMLAFGRNLVLGLGVDKNVDQGTMLMNKSVEMGNPAAMNELGSMYYYGRGVKVNPERGMRFYKAALVRDDAAAMNNIGVACLKGGGVQKDAQKALTLFMKASAIGHPKAPVELGTMYLNGDGVPKDLASAAQWYQIGADRGDYWAAAKLAFIYSKGPAKLRDLDKAVRYAALAVALDKNNEAPNNKDVLKALPAQAKQKVIKDLVAEVGAANAQSGADLDETLVLLSRQAWRNRNPLISQF